MLNEQKMQLKNIGKAIAALVHYTLCWDEPMDSDAVDDLCLVIKQELNKLNGNM